MPEIFIRDIAINFPYQAYECQMEYMTKVIDSLMGSKNAILESPTGTGKTLCLLCACLAWQDNMRNTLNLSNDGIVKIQTVVQNNIWGKRSGKSDSKVAEKRDSSLPKIIYTSRTHSQLSQCIKALKGCSYGNNRKVGMIASRDQLCINSTITALETTSARIYGCRKSVQRRSCRFYNQWDKKREEIVKDTPIVDIEDLISAGKEKSFCPYYLSRETFTSADIVFMPYNYILDSRVRRMFNIDLNNSVIIFDEAHNIEQVCEDSASVDISSTDIAIAIGELTSLGEYLYDMQCSSIDGESDETAVDLPDLGQVLLMKQRLLKLESAIDSIDLSNNKEGLTENVSFLSKMLKDAGFNSQEKNGFFDLMERCTNTIGMSSDTIVHSIGIKGLEAVDSFLKTVFYHEDSSDIGDIDSDPSMKCYRVYLQEKDLKTPTLKSVWESKKSLAKIERNRVLSFWCLTPGRAMNELMKLNVRNVILTSGTLYPIDTLKMDLNINIGVELRNQHIIKPEQMLVSICTRGPDGEALNSSYGSRDNISYLNSLGNTLVNLTAIIPRGLLVVFPSYGMMKKCIEKWETCNIYSRMVENKQVLVEPQDKVAFALAMQQYQSANMNPRSSTGAVLLAVARGKVSEGLDLSDHCGRGVVVVGLPYPAFTEPRIKLKMAFLDDRKVSDGIGLGGRAWYNLQAYRAVNQSLGRVIRHYRDFGSVYLCDERFAPIGSRQQLPHWIQPMLKVYDNFGDVVRATNAFFRTIPGKYPPTPFVEEEDGVTISSQKLSSTQRGVVRMNDNVLAASTVQSFCKSLKKPETEDLFDLYSEDVINHEVNTKADMSLMSILRKSDYIKPCSVPEVKKRPLSMITTAPVQEPAKKPVKRYKLVERRDENCAYAAHLDKVKRVMAQNTSTMKCYKAAVDQYFDNGNVCSLFSSLQSILNASENPGLIRDFYEHIRAEDLFRFKELCSSILGLQCGDSKENTIVEVTKSFDLLDCVQCNASPAVVPLGAPCKHVCCFGCWKQIIDCTRRCPRCNEIVRKKFLVKIVTQA